MIAGGVGKVSEIVTKFQGFQVGFRFGVFLESVPDPVSPEGDRIR